MERLTLRAVGRHCGIKLPKAPGKTFCPFRKHKRRDKTFRTFQSRSGTELWKCWSCDEPNVGDAIAFYAKLNSLDRRTAFVELRSHFEIPTRRQSKAGPQARRSTVIPLAGADRGPFAELDYQRWSRWRKQSNGLVSRFGDLRGLEPSLLLEHDVIELGSGAVGFGYRDPESMMPCRVKVRALDRKAFWVEPKTDEYGRRARSPLYLAHDLRPVGHAVIITEGEIDALSLRQAGLRDVVSLPDGHASADRVDLTPLEPYEVWYAATDDDGPGAQAAGMLTCRATAGQLVVRVKWKRLVAEGDQEQFESYKDANDALRAGFTTEDFERCLKVAAEQYSGSPMAMPRRDDD